MQVKRLHPVGAMLLGLLAIGCGDDAVDQGRVTMVAMGSYKTGVFDDGAAEIAAYDPGTKQLYVINGSTATIDVLDISDPASPTLAFTIGVGNDVDAAAKKANSVAVRPGGGALAAAIENVDKQLPGFVAFFAADGTLQSVVQAGALPDMLTFTPDGNKVLVANEGEPSDDYTVDPEGSVTIVDVSAGIDKVTQQDVVTAGFASFNDATLDPSIRIYGPGATVAQDLEPEYIAVSEDSKRAWVTLQENNALGVIDVAAGEVTSLVGLGFKNYGASGNGIDASDEDGVIKIDNWPVEGMYQPDAIAAFRVDSETFLLTANEGDSRDYEGFSEETRIADLTLDPTAFPNAAELQDPKALGRLKTTTANGDSDDDGDADRLFSYGARSFSIWSAAGALVYDSGDVLEQTCAKDLAADFNSTNDENGSFDDRSDDKGPEPEGVVIGQVTVPGAEPELRTLAFIGLERIGGVMAFDVTTPKSPTLVQYLNNRDFSGDAAAGTAGDLGPEGLVFIPSKDSPIDEPLLVVANEVSGSTTIYKVEVVVSDD